MVYANCLALKWIFKTSFRGIRSTLLPYPMVSGHTKTGATWRPWPPGRSERQALSCCATMPQSRRRLFGFFMIGALGQSPVVACMLRRVSALAVIKEPLVSICEHLRVDGLACPDHLYFASRNKCHPNVVSCDGQYPTLQSSSGICMARKPIRLPDFATKHRTRTHTHTL
jgi:hypothetical protein